MEEDEEIDDAVAAVLVIETFGPSQRQPRRWRASPMSWVGLSSKAPTAGQLRVWLLGIEVEQSVHAGDVLGVVDLGMAHVLLPRLEMVLGQA